MRKQGLEALWLKHVGIKIGGGPSGGHGQPRGINVVRPFFEGFDRMALRGKRAREPQRKQGFAAAARKSRYAQPGHGYSR